MPCSAPLSLPVLANSASSVFATSSASGIAGSLSVGSVFEPLTPKIERYQRAELARLLDRLDVSEQITGCAIDRAFHAGAVIGFDTLQIQVHQLRGVDLPRLNRAVDVDDCRFFEIKFLRRRQRRPEPEENRHQKRR